MFMLIIHMQQLGTDTLLAGMNNIFSFVTLAGLRAL